jgi:gluconolactonase
MVRTDLETGRIEIRTDSHEGKRFNGPNDVVVYIEGRIWFTDPFYGADRSVLEIAEEAVYRIDPDGTVERVLSQPAIELSPPVGPGFWPSFSPSPSAGHVLSSHRGAGSHS